MLLYAAPCCSNDKSEWWGLLTVLNLGRYSCMTIQSHRQRISGTCILYRHKSLYIIEWCRWCRFMLGVTWTAKYALWMQILKCHIKSMTLLFQTFNRFFTLSMNKSMPNWNKSFENDTDIWWFKNPIFYTGFLSHTWSKNRFGFLFIYSYMLWLAAQINSFLCLWRCKHLCPLVDKL